jgi:hypothetical protein
MKYADYALFACKDLVKINFLRNNTCISKLFQV